MTELYLPTLHTFAMDNSFTGSSGAFRFRVVPNVVKKTAKEVDMDASSLFAEYWHGPYCYEKSQMEGAASFPMSTQGREAMKQWLQSNI